MTTITKTNVNSATMGSVFAIDVVVSAFELGISAFNFTYYVVSPAFVM